MYMETSEETAAARKERRREYMRAYRARKREERLTPTQRNETYIQVSLLELVAHMLGPPPGAG